MTDTKVKYNVVTDDGAPSSVTAFVGGKTLIATTTHPNFDAILDSLEYGMPTEAQVVGMFDVGVALGQKFDKVSERVSVNAGRIFFDGVQVDDVLAQVTIAFHNEGHSEFERLVRFMEKVEINPNEHSRKNLFNWLATHKFGIAPDGDFIAYKGVREVMGELKSGAQGRALVNGVVFNGQIPNKPGTIIEMPRDQVQHNPGVACSTGLHVANFGFAKGYGTVLRVKVNPRDVVSVPTDSGGDKMRVCRYKVIDVVTSEDTTMLFVGDPAKRIAALAPKPKVRKPRKPVAKGGRPRKAPAAKPVVRKRPRYYEQFTKADFVDCTWEELRWIAKEFEVKIPRGGKAALVPLLVRVGRQRKKTW